MSHESLIISEEDVIETYRLQNKLKSYRSATKYLQFLQLKEKMSIKELSQSIGVHIRTVTHWSRQERVPWIIHVTDKLKRKKILPLFASEKLARILGYIHGDGWILNDLSSVGFSNTEISILETLQNDIHGIFNCEGKFEKSWNKGDNVIILGIKRIARKDCYKLQYNDTGIARVLYVAAGVKGRKVFKSFNVPDWIMNGKTSYKREFLRGLFDSELSKFQVISFERHENQITDPRMEMCKSEEHLQSLDEYFTQIERLLNEFQVESYKRGPTFVRVDSSERRIFKYAVIIRSNFRSLHNFITRIGFHSSIYKKQQSEYVLKLMKQKIRNRNKMFDILNYIVNKPHFTTFDFENDLGISKSYSKILAKCLWENGLAERSPKREQVNSYARTYKYIPIKDQIRTYLQDELKLLKLVPARSRNER